MIIVFGSINMDMIFTPDHAPEAGETIITDNYLSLPGGKGANQAVAAARMEANVSIAGCVGEDGFGNDLSRFIEGQNVDISLVKKGENRTGTAVITVSKDGENRIMVAGGTNLEATADQVPDDLLIKGNSLLMQMETSPEQIKMMACKAKGKVDRVILNLAPALPIDEETLSALDMLILNEIEIVQLANNLEINEGDDYRKASQSLARQFNLTCVVTIGKEGAFSYQPDGTLLQSSALPLDKVIDTTGAGDAFCGTLAASLDQGKSLKEAMDTACVAGSLACKKIGATSSYPTRKEVEQYISPKPAI